MFPKWVTCVRWVMGQRKTGRQTISILIAPTPLPACCRQQQPTCSANHVLQSGLHLLYPSLRDMRNKKYTCSLHSCTAEISRTHNCDGKKRSHLSKFEMWIFTGEERRGESRRLDMVWGCVTWHISHFTEQIIKLSAWMFRVNLRWRFSRKCTRVVLIYFSGGLEDCTTLSCD